MANLRPVAECVSELKANVEGLKLDDEQLNKLVEEVRTRAIQLEESGISRQAALDKAAKEMSLRQQLAQSIAKRNKALMEEKRRGLVEVVRGWIDSGGTVQDGLKSLMEGFRRDVKGAFRSLENVIKNTTREDYGGFMHAVDKEGLMKEWRADTHAADIMTILDEKPLAKPNPKAEKIAELVKKFQLQQVMRMNEHGAWITPRKQYITLQEHNHRRVRDLGRGKGVAGTKIGSKVDDNVSFNKWLQSILPKLDTKATFPGKSEEEIVRILKGSHNRIVTEYNGRTGPDGFTEDGPIAPSDVTPIVSVASQVSEARHFVFKDAASWWEYHKEFGTTTTFASAVEQQLNNNAKKAALMSMFGPDPERNLKAILSDLNESVRKRPDASTQVEGLDIKKISNVWYDSWLRLTGFGAFKGLERTKFAANTLVTIARTAKLGGTGITSFVLDRVALWRGMVTRGLTNMESFSKSVLKLNEQNKDEIQAQLFALDSIMDRTIERFGPGNMDAKLRRLENKFFKWTGLNWVTDDNKATATAMLAWQNGRNRGKSFGKLPKENQIDLRGAGIDEVEWETLRRAAPVADKNGDPMLLPSSIKELPDDAFHDILRSKKLDVNPRNIRRAKSELEESYGIYLTDQTDAQVITPGTSEQRILSGGFLGTQGAREGSLVQIGLKMMTQFRSFPVAYMNRFANRSLHHAPAGANKGISRLQALATQDHMLWTVGNLVALSMGAFMVMEMKSILRGQGAINPSQQDPDKQIELMKRVLLTSGTLGIISDMFFEDYDQGFNAASKRLLGGPIFGDMGDGLFAALGATTSGDPGKGGEIFLKTLRKNLPFANIPIAGDAFNYIILDAIQNMASPGSVEERDARIGRLRPETVDLGVLSPRRLQ